MKVLENEFARLEFDGRIVFCEFIKENTHINMDMAIRLVNDRLNFTEGRPHCLCLRTGKFSYADKEVRNYMQSSLGIKNIIAGAIITESAVTSVFFNFFIKISGVNKIVPAKCFALEEDAIEWLKQFKHAK